MNYQNGKIYRIDCNVTGKVYIGSTCQSTLECRLASHRYALKEWNNCKRSYVSSFEIIENGNYKITLIEEYPCNSKYELREREGFYIKSINCINKLIAGRTKKEYYQENKEYLNEKKKEWRTENKEEIAEQIKKYREKNKEKIEKHKKQIFTCECGSTYTNSHKSRHEQSKKHILSMK